MSLVPGEDAADVRQAIDRVIDRGWFILGPEVSAFEDEFAAASGAAHAVGVGTGTDAIALILRALDIGAGDEVITSPLSAAYSALAIMMAGARPVFADIDPQRGTIDPDRIAERVGPRTRAILPVQLYGQPADMAAIGRVAERHSLRSWKTAASALATSGGRPVGTIGTAGAFSFIRPRTRRAWRRWRGRHQRCRAGRPCEATARRRAKRSLSSSGAGLQLAPRRHAGRRIRARLPRSSAGRLGAARWRHATGAA
jgi:hypothetical protein